MNILLTTLDFASAHIVVIFIAFVCVLSLIAMVVSETRSKRGHSSQHDEEIVIEN